jgi:hypothetical protein
MQTTRQISRLPAGRQGLTRMAKQQKTKAKNHTWPTVERGRQTIFNHQ